MDQKFELLFEGPGDESAPTLRRIKGVFVADLDFPAADVQRFLENAPITIKSGNSEGELQEYYDLLVKAGARVLIIKKEDAEDQPAPIANDNSYGLSIDSELPPLELEFDSVLVDNPKEIVPSHGVEIESLELSLDLAPAKAEDKDGTQPSTKSDSNSKPQSELFLDLSLSEPDDAGAANLKPAPSPQAAFTPSTTLELEVMTPAGSTLFAQSNTSPSSVLGSATTPSADKPDQSPSDELSARQSEDEQPSSTPTIAPQENSGSPLTTFTGEEQVEEPVELTFEELKALQKPARRPFKVASAPVLVILGLFLLFQINQTLLSSDTSQNPFSALLAQIPHISPEQDAAEQAKRLAQKAAELSENSWYSSEKNFPDRSIKANVWVEKRIPIHGSIEITTPQPAPLTKEEIVNGILPRPWLKRLELKDLIFTSQGEVRSASGPALAYVSIGEKNIRLSGRATLKAFLNADQNSLTIEASASSQQADLETSDTNQPDLLSFSIDPLEPTRPKSFLFKESIELKKK